MVITQTLSLALFEGQLKFQKRAIKEILGGSRNSTFTVFDPLIKVVNPPIYGSIDPQFRDFMAPGVILSIIFILGCGLTALTLVIERKKGLMERTQVAGVTQVQIMAGQILLQFFVMSVQVSLLLVFAFLVFKITMKGNIGLVILILMMQGLLGISLG